MQVIIIEDSKLTMEYCFILNQGTPTFLQIDQSLYLYSSYINLCCNNNEIYTFPQIYANLQHQPQLLTECDYEPTIPIRTSNTDSSQKQTTLAAVAPHHKPRLERTLEKETKSAKKNSQSNIINQLYSFYANRQKSQKIVQKSLTQLGKTVTEIQKIIPIFYTVTRLMNCRRSRRYVNVASLMKYFTVQALAQCVSESKDTISQIDFVCLKDICLAFRRCAKYFIEQISINAILTSKRISLTSKEAHLKKRRRMVRSINTK